MVIGRKQTESGSKFPSSNPGTDVDELDGIVGTQLH